MLSSSLETHQDMKSVEETAHIMLIKWIVVSDCSLLTNVF